MAGAIVHQPVDGEGSRREYPMGGAAVLLLCVAAFLALQS